MTMLRPERVVLLPKIKLSKPEIRLWEAGMGRYIIEIALGKTENYIGDVGKHRKMALRIRYNVGNSRYWRGFHRRKNPVSSEKSSMDKIIIRHACRKPHPAQEDFSTATPGVGAGIAHRAL